MPVLVTGATGLVGGSLVRSLVAAGHPVRVLTRTPGSVAAQALPASVEVVEGDFDRPDSLRAALRGVSRMHLVAMGGAVTHGADVVEAAVGAGVRRITHLGHHDPGRADDDPIERGHRALHRAIENSGVDYTHVFPGEFMANTREWAPSVRGEGVVRAPFGGWRSALVHEADIAAVLAAALLDDGHEGATYRPTGPVAIARRDAVAALGAALGRPVRFVELTPEQARERWAGTYPSVVIDWFLEMGRNPDGNAWVSPDVERITGRPGRTYAEWAVAHAAEFR
ncbi:MAG TPA: NmrA family NAD(P)-binding protein [Actinocatenispora sp.]